MKRQTWGVFVVVLLVAGAAAAAKQGYFETFEIRLHNLDVVVTDAEGRPVRGLTNEDFIVLENGVPQNVTNFSAYEDGAPDASANAAAPPRRFVFFVDDMSLHQTSRKALIRHATGLVDEMREGDVGAVVRPIGDRIVQSYTTDTVAVRNALAETIETCKLRGVAPWVDPRNEQYGRRDSAGNLTYEHAHYVSLASDRVRQRLLQLRALVASMSGIEGRKVLVVLTSGLSSNPSREVRDYVGDRPFGLGQPVTEWGMPGADFNPIIDELARTAAHHGITIYALEPEVPLTLGLQKTADTKKRGTVQRLTTKSVGSVAERVKLPFNYLDELQHYRAQTLTSLTEKTGGAWFRGIATIDDVFRQVSTDLDVYYSLAYRATGEADKPRRLTVQVRNRPELRVRTRTDVIDRSPEREMGDLTAANLLFPRELNELNVAVATPAKPSRGKRFYTVPVDVSIPLQSLTFFPTDGDKYHAAIDVHFAAAALRTNYTTSGRHRQDIEISAAQYATLGKGIYRFKTGIEVPAGSSRIAIGVMDKASRLAGFGNLEVHAK
jgi:VWFA-related protein